MWKRAISVFNSVEIDSSCFKDTLRNIDSSDLIEIQRDIEDLERTGNWSQRLTEIMERAKLISDADQLMTQFEDA